ncbi:MAG: PAS domain-containing protein [Gammaproteobacteria bacterium]|nr:PAS domain-containing protein [Gammaproteobacteria bacterium]
MNASFFHLTDELNVPQIERVSSLQPRLEREASFNKYLYLYPTLPAAYFILNKKGLIVDVNKTGEKLLEKSKNKLVNRCFSFYLTEDYQLLFSRYRQMIFQIKSSDSYVLKFVNHNQLIFFARCNSNIVTNPHNGQEELFITLLDISRA